MFQRCAAFSKSINLHEKKTTHAPQANTHKVQLERFEYCKKIAAFDFKQLVFLDETGIQLGITQRYARSEQGQRAYETLVVTIEGIDGIIKEDRLGLEEIYIQAKRWNNVVGRPEIQKFVGALAGKGATKGILITTAKFSEQAKSYYPKNETKVVLIDGEELAEYMIDFELGVSTVSEYKLKKIDTDYFEAL